MGAAWNPKTIAATCSNNNNNNNNTLGGLQPQHYKKCNQLAMFFSHQTRYFSEIRGHSFDPYPIQEWLIEYLFKSLGVKVRHPKVRYLVYSQTILDGYLVIQAFCGFPNKMLTQLRNGPWLAVLEQGLRSCPRHLPEMVKLPTWMVVWRNHPTSINNIHSSQKYLVGGRPIPLKNDGVRQLGSLFPTEWKN